MAMSTIKRVPEKRWQHPLVKEIRRQLKVQRGRWPAIAREAKVQPRSLLAIYQGTMREMTASRELSIAKALGIKVRW